MVVFLAGWINKVMNTQRETAIALWDAMHKLETAQAQDRVNLATNYPSNADLAKLEAAIITGLDKLDAKYATIANTIAACYGRK